MLAVWPAVHTVDSCVVLAVWPAVRTLDSCVVLAVWPAVHTVDSCVVLAVWPVVHTADTVQRDETSLGVQGTGRETRYVGLFHLLSETLKRTRNNVLATLFCVRFPVLWIKGVY